jgi:hypothetical protein
MRPDPQSLGSSSSWIAFGIVRRAFNGDAEISEAQRRTARPAMRSRQTDAAWRSNLRRDTYGIVSWARAEAAPTPRRFFAGPPRFPWSHRQWRRHPVSGAT